MSEFYLGGPHADLRYDLLDVNGSTRTRGAQAFTFDAKNKHLYVFEAGAINRYRADQGIHVSAIDRSNKDSPILGHQGLSTEVVGNAIKLWCTSAVVGRSAVRFDYVPGGDITTGEVFELFKVGEYANSSSCTPTVSTDGKYLLAHGTKFGTMRTFVRVFLMSVLKAGPGDYTDKFAFEWETDGLVDAGNPLQGMASDGKCAYLMAGGTGFGPEVNKRFHAYDLTTGRTLYKNNDHQVGRIAAGMEPTATRYEPEGLAIYPGPDQKPMLLSGILMGDPGMRRFKIYQLFDEYPSFMLPPIPALKPQMEKFTDFTTKYMGVPENSMNEILVSLPDGRLDGRAVFMPASIVENDADLNVQKGAKETFKSVFNWWKRISRGGPTLTDERYPAELDTWSYDEAKDAIRNTTNSAGLVGFVSPEKYENFVLEVNVSSTDGDDDYIGVIIAYALDKATNETHILTATRMGNGRAPFIIDKNLMCTSNLAWAIDTIYDGLTWMDGTVATKPIGNVEHGGWNLQPLGTTIRVTRNGDNITIETTQVGEPDTYFAPAARTINLNSDPRLAVFKGPQSFGYHAASQRNSTWLVRQRPETHLPIVDTRDWSKWVNEATGWKKYPRTKQQLIDEGVLAKEWMHHNVTTGKFYYIDSNTKVFRL